MTTTALGNCQKFLINCFASYCLAASLCVCVCVRCVCDALLYCALLCCALLYCALLYCALLYCALLYCALLYCALLCSVLLWRVSPRVSLTAWPLRGSLSGARATQMCWTTLSSRLCTVEGGMGGWMGGGSLIDSASQHPYPSLTLSTVCQYRPFPPVF